jgi:hypothetical protein
MEAIKRDLFTGNHPRRHLSLHLAKYHATPPARREAASDLNAGSKEDRVRHFNPAVHETCRRSNNTNKNMPRRPAVSISQIAFYPAFLLSG